MADFSPAEVAEVTVTVVYKVKQKLGTTEYDVSIGVDDVQQQKMVFICKKYLSTLHTNKYSDNFLILPLFSLIEYDKSCIAHIIYSWSKSKKSAVLARFIFVSYPCLF